MRTIRFSRHSARPAQLALVTLLIAFTYAVAFADPVPDATAAPRFVSAPGATIPAGTKLRFHLMQPLSSDRSKTGQPFAFVMLDPVTIDGRILIAAGATGSGTVILAGPSGSGGHEGDLTLRLDSISAASNGVVTFDDQRFEINGRNRKVESGGLSLTPFVGIFARIIRGAPIIIDADTPIETELNRPATLVQPNASTASPAPTL